MARKIKVEGLEPYKKKVPTYKTFEDCKNDYIERVKQIVDETDFLTLRCNQAIWVETKIITPLVYFREKKLSKITYSAEELEGAMELLNEITQILSSKTRFVPTIFTFCKMINISTTTLDNWSYEKNERGEVVLKIQDYFKSNLSQGMLSGEFNPVAGQFIGKTTLGMKERDGNQVNINLIGTELSVDDIMKEYSKKINFPVDN